VGVGNTVLETPRLVLPPACCRTLNCRIAIHLVRELHVSFPGVRRGEILGETLSIPVPVVRVDINGVVTHQVKWSHPVPAGVIKGHVPDRIAGPVLTLHPGGNVRLSIFNPSINSLLRGCQCLPVRAIRAVGTTSGPAGTMQDGGLCMLVVYGRRIQPAPPIGNVVAAPRRSLPRADPVDAQPRHVQEMLMRPQPGAHARPQTAAAKSPPMPLPAQPRHQTLPGAGTSAGQEQQLHQLVAQRLLPEALAAMLKQHQQ
jgi:hypothetical protein